MPVIGSPTFLTTPCTHGVHPHTSIPTLTSDATTASLPLSTAPMLQPRSVVVSDGVIIFNPDLTTISNGATSTVVTTASPNPVSNITNDPSGNGLSGTTIGVIVVSVVLGMLSFALMLWCCCFRGRCNGDDRKKGRASEREKEKRRRARARARARAAAEAEAEAQTQARVHHENWQHGGSQEGEFRPLYMQEPARVYVRD